MNQETGKWLVIIGGIIVLAGLITWFFHDKLHWIGNLPGDIRIERENFRFYFPLSTLIILNLLILLVVYLIRKFNS